MEASTVGDAPHPAEARGWEVPLHAQAASPPSAADVDFLQSVVEAKDAGASAFAAGELERAAELWTAALKELVDQLQAASTASAMAQRAAGAASVRKVEEALYLNLALVQNKLGNYDRAAKACTAAMLSNPHLPKARYRLAEARLGLGQYAAARQAVEGMDG